MSFPLVPYGVLLAAATYFVSVEGFAAVPSSPGQLPDTAGLGALQREVRERCARADVRGIAVAVVDRDSLLWSEGLGLADAAAGVAVEPDTPFPILSVSKSFLALAALRLDSSALPLTTPLRVALPDLEFDNPWEQTDTLRLVHLLEHTSGFDDLDLAAYNSPAGEATLAEILAAHPRPRTCRWPPGTRMAYNNGGYAIVALALERATGTPYREFVAAQVIRPLGLDHTGYLAAGSSSQGFAAAAGTPAVATGYIGDRPQPSVALPEVVGPSGGIVASVTDLAKLAQACLQVGDSFLSAEQRLRLVQPTSSAPARAGLEVGYGLGVYTTRGPAGRDWYGHAGGTPSATAVYAWQPELGSGYALLMNGRDHHAKKAIVESIQRWLAGRGSDTLRGAGGAGPSATVGGQRDIPPGYYRQAAIPLRLFAGPTRLFDVVEVAVAGDTLSVRPLLGDAPARFASAGGGLYRPREGGRAEVAVVDDGGPALAMWSGEEIAMGTYVPVSAISAYAPMLGLALAVVLVGLALVASLVWLGRYVARLRRGERRVQRSRLFAGFAAWALVGYVAALLAAVSGPDGLVELGRVTPTSFSTWLLGVAFVIGAVAAVVASVRALSTRRTDARRQAGLALTLFCSFGCLALALVLTAWRLAVWPPWLL